MLQWMAAKEQKIPEELSAATTMDPWCLIWLNKWRWWFATSSIGFSRLLPPANEVCEGYVFTGVCPQGVACVAEGCAWWGCVWQWEHAWLGCAWWGGMHGTGACVAGGHAWQGWGVHGRYYEIQAMSGQYASYWNAFLFKKVFQEDRTFACCLIQLH